MEKLVVFDVETPNRYNDRISAIGITVLEDGYIADEYYSLVNPEAHFDYFNSALTGITPDDVRFAPTFPQLWEEIKPIFDGGVLAAHNAPFDMGVLSKCLLSYGIGYKRYIDYACTCQMARRIYPHLPNHRLDTLCDYLLISLDHHNAGSDSLAAAKLLQCCLGNGADIEKFKRGYDLILSRTIPQKSAVKPDVK